ncbi:ClpP/crotonase-like domain protein [Vibrio phage vB_VhaM_VH-8]|nr:ClpP/crotonase-like domain protein [Vibrio phage vB_VhaM_VH-8]
MARGQNLLNKIYNKPLLISLDELQPIADYLSSPERVASLKFEKDLLEPPKLEDFALEDQYQKAVFKYLDINPVTMTGVLNIDGVLVNREGQMNSQCVELTSYQSLKKRFEMQVEQGMKSCVLMVSSGGGEAFGAWSTANYVKKVAKENDVKLTAYVNGSSCSAAYVWTVVADEVVSHPMASVGSIGVLVQLYNDSKMLENLGVQRSFVYAGGNKIPFDKEGNFTDKFISDLQTSIDKTYSKFVNHVVQNRDMSEQDVIDTQASVFDSDEALNLGLIDKIMELEDFELEYGLKVSGKSSANKSSSSVTHELSGNNKSTSEGNMPDKKVTDELLSNTHESKPEGNVNMEQLTQLTEQNTQLSAQLVDMGKELNSYKEQVEKLTSELKDKEMAYRNEQRKASLEDALGKDNEKVLELLTTTESLSDEHFNVIVSTLSSSQESMQEKLEEKGGEGQDSDVKLSLSEQLAKRAQDLNTRKAH